MTRHKAIELLAEVSIELARVPPDIEAILVMATSRLSRISPATWAAVVMNPNPETSRIVIADDRDPDMARYVQDYVATIERLQPVRTIGPWQHVIESGSPIVIQNLSFDEFLLTLSPVGQAYCRSTSPPGDVRSVDLMIVPMRVGGATVGTLGMLDARNRHSVEESDVDWMQLVADRIALSVEHARLAGNALVHAGETEAARAIALANRHSGNPRATMGVVVERITALPYVDAADIMLLTEDGKELIVAASAGYRFPWPPEHRLDARSAALELDRRRPEFSHRADHQLEGHNPRRSQFAREGFQTFISRALQSPTRAVGILNLYSRSVAEFDQAGRTFLDTIGDIVTMAISEAAPSGAAPRPTRKAPLSELEGEILRLIAEGLTNREIAVKLYRSENTIKFHVRRILEKAEVANRTELVVQALREGWL